VGSRLVEKWCHHHSAHWQAMLMWVSAPPSSHLAVAPLAWSLSHASEWWCYGVLFLDPDVHDDGESSSGPRSASWSPMASDLVNKSRGEAQFVLTHF
jgi:hypothetical protein